MGFGSKWVGWMWSCLSSAKFSVMVNGVPAGFFPSSKGLRQGDPLSPYLFVMGMEVLDVLIRRAVEGGFLSGCNIRGAASGLRINLAKSEIIPVGEVVEMEELAVELGMPKMVARRLEKVQRDFLWGGGNMEGKTHLVNWEVVCTDKAKGGLGIRKLALLNKALLGNGYGDFGQMCGVRDTLSHCFPHLFAMAVQRNTTVEEMWDQNSGQGNWNLNFLRDFNDWELGLVGDFLQILRGHKPSGKKIQSCGEKEEGAIQGQGSV
ncbi:putative mitochondrial protein [Vitis vinifera]|uniref:Putative mitochondrial protein n=1 Tax=Vitis vinifera TaxID=29760 RepID=A0A438D268_VITVI|nr:putative mitochondrial protein [Vitis vinifera]